MRRSGLGFLAWGTSFALLGIACGEDQGPGQSPLVMEKPATKSGDQQTAPVSVALGNPLRVLITRDGEPVEDVDVDWAAGQGGVLSQETQSDEAGIASVVWTLGPEQGNHATTATIDGAEGSPLTYTATATSGTGPPPGPTIQVLGGAGESNRFEPNLVTINVGQSVTWSWPEGAVGHNVVPDDGDNPIPSGPVTDGPETYSFTFNEPGSFRFFCLAHGGAGGVGMSGRVIVNQGEN
jgi:plastocyanin